MRRGDGPPPGDSSYPIFGLPRVITCEANIDRCISVVDSPANTLCLCTGSLACSPENDIPKLVRKYSQMKRIGSLDMNAIVKALVGTGFDGRFRPNHGRAIWGETGKPGCGLFDRALGSACLNGLVEANGGTIE